MKFPRLTAAISKIIGMAGDVVAGAFSAVLWFFFFAFGGASAIVAGVFLIFGAGVALICGGVFLLILSALILRGSNDA